jgi:hypothetical protein
MSHHQVEARHADASGRIPAVTEEDPMSVSDSSQVSPESQNPALLRFWQIAIVASVVLWLATLAGNIALFAVHPARHWPMLETVETLQGASLIPVALILHQLNQRTTLSRLITTIGIGAMVAGVAIDLGFVTELLTFGQGPIGGPVASIVGLVVLGWLLGANALAWRRGALPRSVAALGVATAATATLLYPVWALRLLRVVEHPTPAIATD